MLITGATGNNGQELIRQLIALVSLAFPADAIRKFRDAVKPIRDKVRNAIEHALEPGAWSKLEPEVVTPSIPELALDQRWFSRVNGVPFMGNVKLRPIRGPGRIVTRADPTISSPSSGVY